MLLLANTLAGLCGQVEDAVVKPTVLPTALMG